MARVSQGIESGTIVRMIGAEGTVGIDRQAGFIEECRNGGRNVPGTTLLAVKNLRFLQTGCLRVDEAEIIGSASSTREAEINFTGCQTFFCLRNKGCPGASCFDLTRIQ